MAVDKLVDSSKLNAALDYEASKIIAKGGGTAPLAFDFANEKGFGDYIDAIPSGSGGLTPPVNASAQFEVSVTASSAPTTITIDFTDLAQYMTGNGARYTYSLMLWRDDVVSSTSYTYIDAHIFMSGRVQSDGTGVSMTAAYETKTSATAMTSVSGIYTDTMLGTTSTSGKTITLTIRTTGTQGQTDRTGKWKGIFTLIPPFTMEYTGTKLTTCPTGFFSFGYN